MLLVNFVCFSASALGAGTENSRRAHDLQMTVDTRWAGGASGGYFPIRIRLANLSRPRTLELVFTDAGVTASRLPSVSRTVQIDQNATQQFTLAIPLVAANSNGTLRVLEDGRELDQLSQHLALPEDNEHWIDRPALLVISPSPAAIDLSQFEAAIQLLFGSGRAASFRSGFYLGGGAVRANDSQVIPPALLPESWIDYTALDLVALPFATFEKLSAAARAAILKWTAAGGTLLVFDVGQPAQESTELTRLLEVSGRARPFQSWKPADPAARQRVASAVDSGQGALDAEGNPIRPVTTPVWPVAPETFAELELLAGRVYAFPGNPFPGALPDWAWWIDAARMKKFDWTSRHGMSSRELHPQFNEFLIPGVGAVPILAFIVLISAFAILIGPVNYFVVWKRKQLYLLVVTIPAIAFVTSAVLFGYAAVADGLSVRSRLRSVTLLDQVSRTAVSFNRISLYAGIAPSDGLRFSPETAVYPVWSRETGFESGSLDWTHTQHLARGWLRSRTRTQFQTVAVRAERGHVDLRADSPGQLTAANGLAWEIELLVAKDDEGRLYAGRKISAGGSTALAVATAEDLQLLTDSLTADSLQAPPGSAVTPVYQYQSAMRYAVDESLAGPMSFSTGLLESYLRRLERPAKEPAAGGLPERSYIATFAENPGVELGIEHPRSSASLHVIVGYYE